MEACIEELIVVFVMSFLAFYHLTGHLVLRFGNSGTNVQLVLMGSGPQPQDESETVPRIFRGHHQLKLRTHGERTGSKVSCGFWLILVSCFLL